MKQLITLFILFSAVLFSCEPPTTYDDGELLIVTTTGMLGDTAKAIAGNKATVKSLMGPGVDPHLYKASQGDLVLLKKADIIIYNGLHLEGKLGEVLEKLDRFPNKTIVAAAEDIPEDLLIVIDEKNDLHDPHIWFDVKLWSNTISPILEAISTTVPEKHAYFKANAEQKEQELLRLDAWVNQQISTIPASQRKLITAHDAFAYFGRAYNIEVEGLQGISTLSEAGIRDITTMVDDLVEKKIKAVFVESSVPKKNLEAVIEGANQKHHEVKIGGTLFSDAMGAEGTIEGTYKGMVEHNINTIVKALK